MILGYNTNGFPHHRLDDTLALLADIGYRAVALTLDHHCLDPFSSGLDRELRAVRGLLRDLGLRCVIETGARFLLDPRDKHQPTLISPSNQERNRRLHFLRLACDIAQQLEADCVSFWSGSPRDEAGPDAWMDRLAEGCVRLCDYAAEQEVRLAFEPEPGMFIDSLSGYEELRKRVGHDNLGLTLDVGHVHCEGEDMETTIMRAAPWLWNMHLDDMKRGIHEHLMFGEGEIDFGVVRSALTAINYPHGAYVELSRHGHDAVRAARDSFAFFQRLGA